MLNLENISFSRGKTKILDDLNASAQKASLTILAGGNGTGKTTLLNCLSGLLGIDSGMIKIKDCKIDPESAEWRKTLSYVPDDGGTIPLLTVEEQLHLQCMLSAIEKSKADERIESIIKSLGLADHRSHRADELSAGFRKKLGLALGLIRDADIYIFDEPFSSLDIEAASAFKELLSLLKNKGRIVILSTHSPVFIQDICDRVWILSNGKIRTSSDTKLLNNFAATAARNAEENNTGNLSWIDG